MCSLIFANSRAAPGMHPGIRISAPQSDPQKAEQTCTINAVVTGNSCNDVGEISPPA
ncbi:MAG: hypothetical protein HUU20_18780 [Pirellulales bacterium]|nr:hypothetical protein [Pirellulales bacterium]